MRRATYGIVAFGLVAALAIVPSRLKPAAYPVERSSIWTGTVETGSMTREVKGQGTLVPVDVLWIPAATDGRVERRFAQAGDRVTPETVLLVLANPELQLAALDAEYEWKAGEARLVDLQVQLRSERLNQEAEAARLDAEYQTAALRAHRDTSLNNEGLLVDLTAKTSQLAVEQLAKRKEIEAKRMAITHEAVEAQLAAQSANVARLEALRQFRRAQVEALSVKAGVAGVLQELSVEVGQRVSAGAILAKVVQPSRLKAELRIAETQANDVTIGQNAVIDTRNSTIQGVVVPGRSLRPRRDGDGRRQAPRSSPGRRAARPERDRDDRD
ncbi:MAG: HlyD family efflux transporter periplasmic adaptor subunit [Bryobacterales bacterium]|nr:HlyD family efflux transporter periplasmic adaptor subunit [Bryobacterales bacterium]